MVRHADTLSRVFRPTSRLAFFLSLLGLLTSCAAYSYNLERSRKVFRIANGTDVALPEIVEDLRLARLVFVGELHNRKAHHKWQLAVIRALHEAGVTVAIGLEMFREESQDALDRWVAGELNVEEFRKVYRDNWNSPWPLYKAIFLYARNQKIPMIGLNIPREITRQVARHGFASLTPDQASDLPEVTCSVDETYMEFIRHSFEEHAREGMKLVYFCEAQVVWDTVMASNLLKFLSKNPTSTVVVLTGSVHAWKRAIPEQIRRRSKVTYRVILPEERERLNREEVSLEDADYLWLGRQPPTLRGG